MNNGEIDKKIEFIIEQQAQFSADIEVMREVHAADTKLFMEQYRNLSDAVTTLVGLVGKIAEAQARTEIKIGEIAEAQARTDSKLGALAEAQTRTEERLNIFINVVERHLGGNGTKGSPEPS